jgi:hypothetical protein
MTTRTKGLLVLAVQLALVLSIAAKYAWERHTCPRVWTRTMQFDPNQPIRGRYLALTLHADACSLPFAAPTKTFGNTLHGWGPISAETWNVLPVAKNGKLSAVLADPKDPASSSTLTLLAGQPCETATLSGYTEFFIAEHARTPFPLAPGDELWAEVTVPPAGPPRPLRLAISDGKQFRVLNMR